MDKQHTCCRGNGELNENMLLLLLLLLLLADEPSLLSQIPNSSGFQPFFRASEPCCYGTVTIFRWRTISVNVFKTTIHKCLILQLQP